MPKKQTPIEKSAFRKRLCEAALRIFVEEGIDSITMRRLAGELGVSAMTPYGYFEDRQQILDEVLAMAYSDFAASQQEALDPWGKPMENLKNLGEAYLRFALEHPLQYSALFLIQKQEPFQTMESQADAFLPLLDTVTQLVDSGELEGDPVLIAHLLWSGRHGLISLELAGRLRTDLSPPLEEMISEMSVRLVQSFFKTS